MAKKYQRIFVIVLDSLGIGSMEDAAEFGGNRVRLPDPELRCPGTLSLKKI